MERMCSVYPSFMAAEQLMQEPCAQCTLLPRG
jgi:hypothetical protein